MKFAVNSKFFAYVALFAILLGVAVDGFAVPPIRKKARTGPALVTFLPASDAAMTLDVKRGLSESLPQILGGNKKMLADVLKTIADMKVRTGIDANQFEEVAAGMSNFRNSKFGFEFDAVMLARGTFNAASVLELAKKAGTFREEKIGERTVLIFSVKDEVAKVADKTADTTAGDVLDKVAGGISNEMAISVWDTNTLVAGTLDRVRDALGTGPRMSPEMVAMVSRNSNALMSFGAKLPAGLTELLPLDLDELGDSLKGIRELAGWMDVAGGMTSLSIAAKTAEPSQAKSLHATLTSLKSLSGLLKSSKRADQKIYGKMVDSIKLGQAGNELTLDLAVPQADLDVILGPM